MFLWIAAGTALLAVLLFEAYRRFVGRRMKQAFREDGPQHHKEKGPVPTGSGIIIAGLLLSGAAAYWFFAKPTDTQGMSGIVVCIAAGLMGLVGWLDDYRKVNIGSEGLKARFKFPLMILVGIGLLLFLRMYFDALIGSGEVVLLNQPWPAYTPLGLFIPLGLFVWLGALNGANFTDGLDGLLSGTSIVVLAGAFYALLDGNEPLALPAAIGLGVIAAFLIFNWRPARLYMGDSGSLAIGALVCGLFLAKGWWLFIGLCLIVWVVEVISVMVQVGSFKLTGKRVLLMSPLHHHFELAGWKEETIVWFFTALQVAGCVAAFIWLRIGMLPGLVATGMILAVLAAMLLRYNKRAMPNEDAASAQEAG